MLTLNEGAREVRGFRTTASDPDDLEQLTWETTTAEYSQHQQLGNVRVTREYIEPICRRTCSQTVVDVGCGVGESVQTLLDDNYDAYGVDLACLTPFWEQLGRSTDRFFVIAPDHHVLPFRDGSADLAFTFGVIEHVGTVDGHATRRQDYHERRAHWLREIFRVVRPGGHLLIGGPNAGFPLDFSHDLDAGATPVERLVSRLMRVSVHRTWGDYFLWRYGDVRRYLAGLDYEMEALSIRGLLQFGRVPSPLRPLARLYIDRLPRPLRGTGCNPWVMALIKKLG